MEIIRKAPRKKAGKLAVKVATYAFYLIGAVVMLLPFF